MKDKKNPTIAILMGDTYTEYANDLIRGFYSCAEKEKVNLIFLMRSSLPRDTNAVLSDMTGEDFQVHFSSIYDYVPLFKPDVLILAYGSLSIFTDTPELTTLLDFFEGIPCVLLKFVSKEAKIPHLVADNYSGMYECVKHLIVDHGYKKIAFLSGPKKNHDASERLRAYYDIMNEYGLPVTDSMVTHGDYSESVHEQVRYLLDSNPGLEAIAFANDTMAKTGYRICEERGLVVGQDLAITGFDDVDMAKTMNPPLTSVMHNSDLFSYQALQNAIQIYNGKKAEYDTLPAVLHKRASCGCSYGYEQINSETVTKEDIKDFVHRHIGQIVDELFSYNPYQEEKAQYRDLLVEFFDDFAEHILGNSIGRYTFDTQFSHLKKLCEHARISPLIMLDYVIQLLRKMILCAEEESVRSSILRILASTQQYVHSTEINALQSKNKVDKHRDWFVNSYIQDLLTPEVSLEDGLLRIMKRFQIMKIENCYVFLLEEPVECKSAYKLEPPKNLYLAAYYNRKNIVSLERSKWMHINSENTVTDIIPQDELHVWTSYVLFSGNTQYGFILCVNEPQDSSFILECSLQIGSFLKFYYLNESEREAQKELEASLKLIKEQNSILNFISANDQMTNLLNRRGFMENAMHAINENIGKTAYILFADLDHLKEINDCFGHAAGDFSLKMSAEYLNACLPESAVTARIGGDEFVSFIISDEEDFAEQIKRTIMKYSNDFNAKSDKPYYIEVSIGVFKCSCDSSVMISDLLQKSDELMYEAKKHRRMSVRK